MTDSRAKRHHENEQLRALEKAVNALRQQMDGLRNDLNREAERRGEIHERTRRLEDVLEMDEDAIAILDEDEALFDWRS